MAKTSRNQPSGNIYKPNLLTNTYFGDVDGDGLQDIIQFSKNRIFSAKCNFERDGVLHKYLSSNIKRLVVGEFTNSSRERGRVQILTLMENGELRAYSSSNDRRTLWYWFAQVSFVKNKDEAIVGDFTGDGRDDILVYTPRTGSLVLYSFNEETTRFERVTNFALGNLEGKNLTKKHIYVGDFGQQSGRADLLVVNPKNGRLSRYDSVTDNGEIKFWGAFRTKKGFVRPGDLVNIANLSGGERDGVVITGGAFVNLGIWGSIGAPRLDFYDAEYENGRLKEQTGILIPPNSPISNLKNRNPLTRPIPWFGKFAVFEGEKGNRRDDLLLSYRTGSLVQLDARHDPDADQATYWWAYSRNTPKLHEGWPDRRKSRWLVARGRLSDASNTEPLPDERYEELFTKSGRGKYGMYRYVHDLSYGTVELDTDLKEGWAVVDKTMAEADTVSRAELSKWCFAAHGLPTPTGYDCSLSIYNEDIPGKMEFGAAGSLVNLHMDWWDQNLIAHEMMHAVGLHGHSFDNVGNVYKDPFDVEGSSPEIESRFSGDFASFGPSTVPNSSGPGIHAFNRQKLGWIPESRILQLAPDFDAPISTKLAALDRPECDGPLVIIIDLQNREKLSIELRENRDWDQAFKDTAVQIRRKALHPNPGDNSMVTYLQGVGDGRLFLAGESFTGFGITVRVLAIDIDAGTANLEIDR